MQNPFRVYLKDVETGEELAEGLWEHSGAYLAEHGTGSMEDVTFTPIGDTPADIGDQAHQGAFGFSPESRTVNASHFPGRTVRVKVWCRGEVRDERILREGTPMDKVPTGTDLSRFND